MTVLVVRCLHGRVEVGDRLVTVRRENGSEEPLDVEIAGIANIAGETGLLDPGEAGRVRVPAGQLGAGLRNSTIEVAPPGRAPRRSTTPVRQQPAPGQPQANPWQTPVTVGRPDNTPTMASWQPLTPTGRGTVGLTVGPAMPMARWDVALRLLLLLPVYVVGGLLAVAAWFVTVVGWFAALVTGELPTGVARYLTGYLAFTARYTAYAWLLTGRYPPFSFRAPDHPVQVDVTPGRLSRLTVFFRGLLLLPAGVLVALVSYGWAVLSVPLWVIALVRGQLPDAAQEAGAAALRFLVRTSAYALMLTDTYPSGLWGDRSSASAALGLDPRLASPQTTEQLVLSRTSRRVVTGLLPLGALGAIGVVLASSSLVGAGLAGNPSLTVELAHARLAQQIQTFQSGSSSCQQAADPLSCLQSQAKALASQFDSFDATLASLRLPSGAAAAAQAVQADAAQMSAQLNSATGVSTLSAYVAALQSQQVVAAGQAFDTDYAALMRSLSAG